MRMTFPAFFTASILAVTAALAQTAPAKIADTSKGKALADSSGMTLYTFDRDTTGTSNCNGAVCPTNWPPFKAAGSGPGSHYLPFASLRTIWHSI